MFSHRMGIVSFACRYRFMYNNHKPEVITISLKEVLDT